MSVNIAAAILAAIGGAKVLEHLQTTPHDRLLKKAVKVVDRNSSDNATLYVDHIDTSRSDGNPDGVVDGINGVPDIIVRDFPKNLVVEVEDADGLQSPGRVLDQLNDFGGRGHTTVLLVPDEEETLTVGEKIADQANGSVEVTTASGIADLL